MANSQKSAVFELLRAVDRIGRDVLGKGPAALLSLILRRQREGRWYEATGEGLAAMLKASRRSVVRWLAELKRLGLLAVWRRYTVREGQRVALPSRYKAVTQAVMQAGGEGLGGRALVLKARLAAALARVRSRVCAKPAPSRAKDISTGALAGLYARLATLPQGSREAKEAWEMAARLESGAP